MPTRLGKRVVQRTLAAIRLACVLALGLTGLAGIGGAAAMVSAAWGQPAAPAARPVPVEAVFDGDTCRLAGGARVRLAGIDAPELAHDGQPAQYYAAESKNTLSRLVAGAGVQFVGVGPGHDRFGRLLGDLLLPSGVSAAERLVAEGAAFCFWFDDIPPPMQARLLAAQQRAMAAGKGFWPRLLSLPAPPDPYIGNVASRRFHAPGCPDAARIARRNRVLLPTLRETFAQGFAPARECTPWPNLH